MGRQISAGSLRSGQITEAELKRQSERFLRGFVQALKSGDMDDVTGAAWGPVRELLGEFARARRAGIYARGNGDLRLLLEGAVVYLSKLPMMQHGLASKHGPPPS